MQILKKLLSPEKFSKYLKDKDFGKVLPNKLVIHHTWRPTVESWAEKKSLEYLKKYYEGLGWSAGPHIFVAPEGIWLFTDMDQVGIHAGAGNADWEINGKTYGGYKIRGGKLTGYSIGIEVVGNYDEKVWEGDVLHNALSCISELRQCLDIDLEDIKFHRDYSNKSCPGNAITREWFEEKLEAFENGEKEAEHGYVFQISPSEAKKALELEFIDQVDSETREILAIGLVRVYERLKSELG